MKTLLFLLAFAVLSVQGCDKKNEPVPPRAVSVGVVEAVRKDAPVVVGGVGHVVALRTVSVAPQVTGYLKASHIADGALVREGQPLFTIDQAPFAAKVDEARAALSRDWAKAGQSSREYARYKELVAKQVISQEEFEQRRTQYEADWRQVQADQAALDTARINLAYCSIASPVTGAAGYQLVRPGNPVSAYTSTLVTINQMQPIWVRFSVNETELGLVRKHFASGRPLAVTAQAPKEERPLTEQGRLAALDNTVDVQTGMITLQAQFDNAGFALWPGQYVNVSLTLDVEKDQLLVPADALIRRQDGAFLFVVGTDNKAELRKVKPGRLVGGKEIVILEGINAGEKLITEGVVRVAPGAPVTIAAPGGAK